MVAAQEATGEEVSTNVIMVKAYVDGACRPNPGRGGWGIVLRCGRQHKELSGARDGMTNQRAEVQAAIEALKALKKPCRVEVYSDSMYLTSTANGAWATRTNLDLWEELFQLADRHEVSWHWVRGHNGNRDNERAHLLANRAIG